MAFLGCTISFNGISSEDYYMVIGSFSQRNSSSKLGTSATIVSDRIVRRDKSYVYGMMFEDVLEYDVELLLNDAYFCNADVPRYLDYETRREIERWLFNSKNYGKFIIEDDDMDDIFYNAILQNPETITIDGAVVGYKFTLVNDSPYAYSNPKKITKTGLTGTNALTIVNNSDQAGYTYPIIEFKLSAGDSICIKNLSDNGREFRFDGVTVDEVITVDNERQIITSSTGISVSNKFNKKFFRLLQGKNQLEITGDIESLYIEHRVCRLGAV